MDRDSDRDSAPRADDAAADRSPSRRAVLIGGAAVVLAGGAGVAAGRLTGPGHPTADPRPAPAALLAALRDEESLVTAAEAVLTADPASRRLVSQIRSDHRAHLAALRAALAPYDPPVTRRGGTSPSPTPTPATPPKNRAGLRAREQQAAAAGARRSARLAGRDAALLASIAACEAGHGELLS